MAIGQSHSMKPQKSSKKEHVVKVKKFVKIFKKGLTTFKKYSIINVSKEREVSKMDRIKNCPDYAKDYEFVVVRQDDNGDYWFWGAYENGFKAEQACLEIGGIIFHNVRIQGKR